MTDPNDSNDDWAELAREFALDKPAPEEAGEPAPLESDAEGEGAELVTEAAGAEGDGEFDDADEAATGESSPEGDGAGGPGRKRRRRRRRRRKGGAPGEAAPVGAAEDGAEEAEAPDEVPESEPVVADDEPGRDEAEEADDFDTEPAPLTAEEDTANEVLRELIATWNVPSWDSIIGGLYRPN